MSDSGAMHEMLGRVLATQDAHGQELALLRQELRALGILVEQHRTGWKVFCFIGATAIAILAAFGGFIRN